MRIMVTGGRSMIGRQVCEILEEKGHVVDPVPHEECDLCKQQDVLERFRSFAPRWLVHLAGYNGGIEWNSRHPETIFHINTRMALNVLETSAANGVERALSVISACAYPDIGDKPAKESDLWRDLPNKWNECHGLAKRNLHSYSRQLNRAGKSDYFCAIVNNSYGPFDSFHPLKTKVVAALIRKFVEATQDEKDKVECWGSGKPRREFLYCKDVAAALVLLLEQWDTTKGELVNVGYTQDFSIKELAEQISKLVSYTGIIEWNTSKPDGQMRRLLDSSLIGRLGWEPKYTLKEGLKETIEWYLKNKKIADRRFNL